MEGNNQREQRVREPLAPFELRRHGAICGVAAPRRWDHIGFAAAPGIRPRGARNAATRDHPGRLLMFSWFGKVSFVPYTKVSDFAVHLKDGRLMGSVCTRCGYATFPPRADCPSCLGDEFEFVERSGEGTIYTLTTIAAAPTGFDELAPYTVAVVDLAEGGRLLAWVGETIPRGEAAIGMPVQVVPRLFEEQPEIRVYYTIEKPGTSWGKAPRPSLA